MRDSTRSRPKNILKPNWKERRIDTSNSEAKESSVDSSKRRETCHGEGVNDGSVNKRSETCRAGETCPEIDFRVQDLQYSTVEQQDTTRKEIVKELIHQIETHLSRDAPKADLQQNQAYKPFSEKSMDMIHSMENVEYFEMCEISPKIPVPSLPDVLHERDRVLQMRILPTRDR